MTGGGVSRIVFRHWLWATLSRDAKFGPLVCSPGSRKPISPAQLDVTLGRFAIGRTRAATRRPTSPLHSIASSRRLIDMALFRFRHRHQESDALIELDPIAICR